MRLISQMLLILNLRFIKKTRISTVQISRDEEVCCPGYFGEPPDNCQGQ